MSADTAYAKAAAITQGQYSRLSARNDETQALLKVALAKIKELESRANAQDALARTTLASFAAGDTGKGVDQLMKQAGAKSDAAVADYKAAGALAFASDTARAVAAYEAALKLAPNDSEVLRQLAWLYSERLGRYDDALRIAALEIALPDPSAKARGYIDRGNALRFQKNYDGAEDAYAAALDIAAANGLKLREEQALGNLGLVAMNRGDLEAAEDYMKRALTIDIEIGDRAGQAADLANLGLVAKDRGDLIGAEGYHRRALAIDTELGDAQSQAADFANLGNIAWLRDNRAEACDNSQRALRLYEKIGAGDSHGAGIARGNIEIHCAK